MKKEVDITVNVDGIDAELQFIRTVTFGVGEIINNYNELNDKPQIGGVTLQGDKNAEQLGLATINDISWEEK